MAAGGGGSDWDEAAVLSFLKQYYGDSGGLPLHKDRWHMQLHRKAAFARSVETQCSSHVSHSAHCSVTACIPQCHKRGGGCSACPAWQVRSFKQMQQNNI